MRALAAYYTVLADFNYGQAWDTKGWYWSPAASCRDRIAELSPKSIKELLWKLHRCQRSSSFLVRRGFVLHCVKKERRGVGLIIFLGLMRPGLIGIIRGSSRVDAQPENIEFIPMTWGAWGKDGFAKTLQRDVVPQIQSGKPSDCWDSMNRIRRSRLTCPTLRLSSTGQCWSNWGSHCAVRHVRIP